MLGVGADSQPLGHQQSHPWPERRGGEFVGLPDVLDHRTRISAGANLPTGDPPESVAPLHDVSLEGGGRHGRFHVFSPAGRRNDSRQSGSQEEYSSESNPCSSHASSISNTGSPVKRSNTCLIPGPRRATVPFMEEMTPRQQRILEFIRRTVRERGYPPTVREIGEAVGLTSSSSVHAQIANLQRKGLLRKDAAKPRAIEVGGGRPTDAVVVPLVGRIAAGAPVMADEHVEEFLPLPSSFAGDQGHFALAVRGDSMMDAGILDGDLVVVRQQESAEDGAIVAVLLPGPAEDEATVKRLQRRGGQLMLVPENPTLEPFAFPENGRILGVVISVLRRL